MWPPSSTADDNSSSKTKSRRSSSSTSSSSPSSSSSSSSFALPQTPKRKAMEQAWKDINLSALSHNSPPPQAAVSGDHCHFFRNMILQDFLAGAFKSPPSSSAAAKPPQIHHPPTALCLSSGLGSPTGPPNLPRHSPASSPFVLPAKKLPLQDERPCNDGGDRHHMRMMKNRESAARSRARKQAYTNELELEVAHRSEENARLKKQNEELRRAMAAQISKKDLLQRTSSAPF